VDISEARQIEQRVRLATAPDRLPSLTLPELQELHESLCQARFVILQTGYPITSTDDRLQMLQQEIEAKRAEERSERHHVESVRLDRKILRWTRWAVAVGVVVPILVALIADIPFSKLLHARASKSSRPSSAQTPSIFAPSKSRLAEKSPSAGPTASPTPVSTSTPVP
jgi:hypothetical protein